MKVKIQLDENEPFEIELTDFAIDLVRFKFNPGGHKDVEQIKTMTVALMSKIMLHDGPANFEMNEAIRCIQTASMWSVLTATKGK